MKLNATEENVYQAVNYLLKINKVKVTPGTVRERLWMHPDFPGLTAVSDVLDELNVPHMTAKLSSDMLGSLPMPALLLLNIDGGLMAPVMRVSEGKVEWMHTRRGIRKEPVEEFCQKWTGVTLMTEYSDLAGDPNYEKKKKQERRENLRMAAFFVAALFSVCGTFFYHPGTVPVDIKIPFYEMAALKCGGAAVSLLLVWYNLNSSSSFLRRLCRACSSLNCENLLDSGGSRIFGANSSEIGLIYFVGTLTTMFFGLFTGDVPELLAWLIVINMISIPCTLYFLYHQAFVVRRWCLLCIAVQLLLWAEFYVGYRYSSERSLLFVSNVLPVFLVITPLLLLFWFLIRKGLIASLHLPAMEKTMQQLKFDVDYVRTLFGKQSSLPPFSDGMKMGRLGGESASNTLIIVTNPGCDVCAQAQREVRALVSPSNDLQVLIIFSTSYAAGSEPARVAGAILNLPESDIPGMLEKWFLLRHAGKARWHKSMKTMPSDFTGESQLELHLSWAELAGVNNLPCLFLNGIELPRVYSLTDVDRLCRQLQTNKEFVRP
jgi:uncharacterized membrane protein